VPSGKRPTSAGERGPARAAPAESAREASLADASRPAPPLAPLCSVFRRYLKSIDLKYTPERAAVLDAVIEHDGRFEVDELIVELRRRGARTSKATVYRTIHLLLDAGIITQSLFDPRQAHYQLIYGRAPCDQMVCVRTGRTIEFSDPEIIRLRDLICARHGWTAVAHRLQIYGQSPH